MNLGSDFIKVDTAEERIKQLFSIKTTYEYANRTYNYLSPTDLDTCSLALYYKLTKAPGRGTIDYQRQRYFNRGIDSETRFMADLEQTGMLVGQQLHVYTDEPFCPTHGKIDAIICERGILKIVEHTTKSYFAFKKLESAPENKIKQWNWYAGMTGIHEGYITVDGGAEDPIRWFPMEFDQELFQKCVNKFQRIYNSALKNTPPVADFSLGSKECVQCLWYTHHYGNEK